jgi:transcriptional regulator with GAF, ATPase, and Fis domain
MCIQVPEETRTSLTFCPPRGFIELSECQRALPEIELLGASLVAISPELPCDALATEQKNHLTFGRKIGKRITCIPGETLSALIAFSWPGNVRELQNLIERAVIPSNKRSTSEPAPTSDKNAVMNSLRVSDKNPLTLTPSQGTFNDSTRRLVLQALQEAGWVIGGSGGAAARLGLKRTTLIAKMKKLGISPLVNAEEC